MERLENEMKEKTAERFDELLLRVVDEPDIEQALRVSCGALGVDHMVYHLAHNISLPIDSPFVRTTYSPEWIARYLLNNYVEDDPVVQRGFQSSLPFHWSDLKIETPVQQTIFMEALAHGVGQLGYSIPITDKAGRRALFSLNHSGDPVAWMRLIDQNAALLAELGQILHRKALLHLHAEDRRPPLSPRELECLNWTAQGKDASTIAEILEISDHTVRDYLKSAKYKLGCGTIAQAVYEATRLRLINL